MLGNVRVEDGVDDDGSDLDLQVIRHILYDVALLMVEQDLEPSRYVMVFKHAIVTVTDGQGMFGSDHELVRVAGMLVVMNQTGYVRRVYVVLLQVFLHISIGHDELHSLHTVDHVVNIVILILLGVPELDLRKEVDQILKLQMVAFKDIQALEDLKCQEMKAIVHAHLVKRKSVKRYLVQILNGLLIQLTLDLCQVNLLQVL